MTIHSEHPFVEPPDDARRFRGRLGGAVTLWTAGDATDRAGLTVSSVMLANGEPPRLVALLDPDSDLVEVLLGTGRAVVSLLDWRDRGLADAFGGVAPAPGGPFRLGDWEETTHGPALAGRSRASVQVVSTEETGWSLLVVAVVEDLVLVDEEDPLEHRRGRYQRSGQPR